MHKELIAIGVTQHCSGYIALHVRPLLRPGCTEAEFEETLSMCVYIQQTALLAPSQLIVKETHAVKAIDRYLVTQLAIVLLIKLVVLAALWWVFVRDQRVTVDDHRVADQFLSSPSINPTSGELP